MEASKEEDLKATPSIYETMLKRYRFEYIDSFFRKIIATTRLRQPLMRLDDIRHLAETPFTFTEMFNRNLVYEVLIAENVNRLLDQATRATYLWTLRKGYQFADHVQGPYFEWALTMACITAIGHHVADAFGLTGYYRLVIIHFMEKLYKLAKQKPITDWPKLAEELAQKWSEEKPVPLDALKAAAHMTLKLMTSLLRV